VPASEWLAFLDEVLAGRLTYSGLHDRAAAGRVLAGPFTVRRAEDGTVELAERRPDSAVARYTQLEWEVFVAGVVHDGEFTLEWLLRSAATQPA
jgi:hypothetical protein